MTQTNLFDIAEGRARRDEALDRFEQRAWVLTARRVAYDTCQKVGFVTSDDLQAACPPPEGAHVNIMGSVLRYPYFAKWGETQSKRPQAKARWIHRWVIGPAWRKYADG